MRNVFASLRLGSLLRPFSLYLLATAIGIGCASVPDVASYKPNDTFGQGGSGSGGVSANGGNRVDIGNDAGMGNLGGAAVGGDGGGETAVCGNSLLDPNEGCDDGNAKSGDGCDGSCKVENGYSCVTPGQPCTSTLVCGDGLPGPDEACDDGNLISGDGCSAECAVESGFSCANYGEPCTPTTAPAVCGNQLTEFGETCDDGNLSSGDGCSKSCQTEEGYTCNGTKCTLNAACGDGVLNTGEQCDDGNRVPGDCCNGNCQLEPNCKCATPTGGGAQVCTSTIVCGDGSVNGDEACDDGNQVANDGCSSECRTVEAGYTCPPEGGVCSKAVVTCPNAKIDAGEECDDGNAAGNDGCSSNCKVEAGFICPTAGQACKLKEFCGNGVVSYTTGETCDDGNATPNDGCSATCTIEAGYTCNSSASPSVCTFEVCGNKKIAAGETCDDGNQSSGDGCSNTCRLETGYTCPELGAPCRSICGDKRTKGTEQCDDGNQINGDGCNARCQLEPGSVCDANGNCRKTVCGDKVKEGTEQCDDTAVGAKDMPFDGCYNCLLEPSCALGPCDSTCGDGQRFSDEACDDGNTFDGDGCSSSCKVETGFTCTDSAAGALPTTKQLPIIVRDFVGLGRETSPGTSNANYHVDFNRHLGTGIFRMVKPALSSTGKPEWRWLPYASSDVTNVAQNTTYTPLSTATCTCNESAASGSWVTTNETWTGGTEGASKTITLVRPPCSCTNATACTCDNTGHMFRDSGVNNSNRRNFSTPANFNQWFTDVASVNLSSPYTLNLTLTDAATAQYSNLGAPNANAFDPIGTLGGWIAQGSETASGCGSGQTQNVSFSTETHFWFEYQGGERFDFSGDDDTWVFVNKKLVVDLGGLHGMQTGYFILDADTDGAGADTADGTAVANGNGYFYDGTNYSTTQGQRLNLGLLVGKVYELVMFQAERNQCGSNFGITLKNFGKPKSNCASMCGDKIVASDEACDLGTAANTGAYGGCNANCTLAPYCGDGKLNGSEQCDDGVNANVYGSQSSGCAPGCKIAPHCGDANVDVAYGEACDEGSANSATAYGPGACTKSCQPAPFCGDGIVNGAEACDEGQNNGGPSSHCDTNCAVKCGNGKLDPGEQCDKGSANNTGAYGGCKANCTLGPYCGDGVKQSNEACDDGKNDGSYGTCTATCQFGSYCGDGVLDGAAGEQCDAGAQNQSNPYGLGLCASTCKNAPYCGDHAVDVAFGEKCDDGAMNSNTQPGACKTTCSGYNTPPKTCGNGTLEAGEDCDNGSLNGTSGNACDARCRFKCGNGIKDAGEECDNGVNDGSYGTCKHDCTLAEYCGDGSKNGPEQCDLGLGNEATPYGAGKCTTACKVAPYCGDHRVNGSEVCDGQVGCNASCLYDVVK